MENLTKTAEQVNLAVAGMPTHLARIFMALKAAQVNNKVKRLTKKSKENITEEVNEVYTLRLKRGNSG